MKYREFVVPAADDFARVLGVEPLSGDEIGVMSFTLDGGGATVEVTVDPLGRSVSVVLRHADRELARIFREGATALRLSQQSPEITVEFRTDDTSGTLEIGTDPAVHVAETSLFT
jgi:hypothetical protein